MKAVYITEHGNLDVLTYGELPDPILGDSDVLIRVRACALNRLDLITRTGARGTKLAFDNPHILGGDVSGDIVEVGAHYGEDTLRFLKFFPNSNIYCFEPDPRNILIRNIKRIILIIN